MTEQAAKANSGRQIAEARGGAGSLTQPGAEVPLQTGPPRPAPAPAPASSLPTTARRSLQPVPSPVLLTRPFLMLTVLVWFPFLPGEGPTSGKGEAPSSLGVPLGCFRESLLSGPSWRSGCFPFPKYQGDLLVTWALTLPYWDQEHFSQAGEATKGLSWKHNTQTLRISSSSAAHLVIGQDQRPREGEWLVQRHTACWRGIGPASDK